MYGNISETLAPEPQLAGAGKPPTDRPRTMVDTGGPEEPEREPHPETVPPRKRQPSIRNLPDMGVEVTVKTATGSIAISVFEVEGVIHIDASGPSDIPVQFYRGTPE
jgi:hypothetical protein